MTLEPRRLTLEPLPPDSLVFDNSPLSHFARADRLQVLEELTADWNRRVTRAVMDEVRQGSILYPELRSVEDAKWLSLVAVDGLQELAAFAHYARILGSGERDVGEASTLAWAEVNSALAIVDKGDATRIGREQGVEVHGSLWLIGRGHNAGLLSEHEAEDLVDRLVDVGSRFPCDGTTFLAWARAEGICS